MVLGVAVTTERLPASLAREVFGVALEAGAGGVSLYRLIPSGSAPTRRANWGACLTGAGSG